MVLSRMNVLQTNPPFSLKISLDSPELSARPVSGSEHYQFQPFSEFHRNMDILLVVLLFINSLVIGETPISQEDMTQFGQQMEPYFAAAGHPTDTSNTSLHELPRTYWGATVWSGRCTNRVYLSDRFADPGHPFSGKAKHKQADGNQGR